MSSPILERVAHLLCDAPARSLPLARLHEALAAPPDPPPPAPDVLASLLGRDPRFDVAAGPDPFDAIAAAWDRPTRDRYRSALRTATAPGLRVTLRQPEMGQPDPADAIALLAASLRQLHAAELPGMADRIAEAHAEYGALARLMPPPAE
jgi:hypothetical protein